MAAQWSSVAAAANLHRWTGPCPCRCGSPLPVPFRAALPRQRNACRTGCASVPRELGAAAEAEAELPPVAVVEEEEEEEEGVACGGCGGAGWVICDFCEGKKNNVKSPETSSRVYRRCPTCKAAGFILCPRCRVYKCVTFPESDES